MTLDVANRLTGWSWREERVGVRRAAAMHVVHCAKCRSSRRAGALRMRYVLLC